MLLFVIVLPSPTVYFYRKDAVQANVSGPELGDGFEKNPLAIEVEQSADKGNDDGSESTAAKPARAKLAKMQREGKDARAQNQKLQAQVQQLEAQDQQRQEENQQLQEENKQLQEENTQLESQSQMDGDAVRKSEAALRKENAALKAQLVEAEQASGTELVRRVSDGTADAVAPEQVFEEPGAAKNQEAAMKDLAIDESLSEEARESAKKALEVLVSSQLLDIEQTAALKKRASALKELESEAEFVDQQARIEALATVKKVEVEALAKAKTAEANAMLQAATQAAEIREMEAEAQFKRLQADAKKLLHAPDGLCDDMMEWLERNRLQHCAADMARIAGAYAAATVSPIYEPYLCGAMSAGTCCPATCSTSQTRTLKRLVCERPRAFIRSSDVFAQRTGSSTTHVQKMRLQAALQALRGAPASS
eukprot:COSAG04_NODE_1158_length_8038_cov_2.977201_2_plen_423_part_00